MPLHRELQWFAQFALPDFADVAAARAWAAELAAQAPPPEQALTRAVRFEERSIVGAPGTPDLDVRIYRPITGGTLPVLLYCHGGSFLMGDLDTDHIPCLHYARDAGIAVVSVRYRLAPEHPFPAGVEDCYAALQWLASAEAPTDFDRSRIAVGGSSAGGTLAAALAIMARDRGGPALALQMLVYPALDDRMTSASLNAATRTYGVTRAVVGHMWRHYLGDAGLAQSPYAAPARVADLSSLAPAYVETTELDPLRDEVIQYAERLLSAGIPAELHVIGGAPHAFDVLMASSVTARAFMLRAAALREALAE